MVIRKWADIRPEWEFRGERCRLLGLLGVCANDCVGFLRCCRGCTAFVYKGEMTACTQYYSLVFVPGESPTTVHACSQPPTLTSLCRCRHV